jgi:hypothetical protein
MALARYADMPPVIELRKEGQYSVMYKSNWWRKSLPIKDLRAQGGRLYKSLIHKGLYRNLILRQNLNEAKRSKTILDQNLIERIKPKSININYLHKLPPLCCKSLMVNEI